MRSPAGAAPRTPEENKAAARRFYEEFMPQGIIDAADELFSEDFVNHAAPPDAPPPREQPLSVRVHQEVSMSVVAQAPTRCAAPSVESYKKGCHCLGCRAEVAREIHVNSGTLGNWVAKYRVDHAGEEPTLSITERARCAPISARRIISTRAAPAATG